jgi:hypothetical protein
MGWCGSSTGVSIMSLLYRVTAHGASPPPLLLPGDVKAYRGFANGLAQSVGESA